MQTTSNKQKVTTAIIITVAFLLLTTFYYYIDKYINGVPYVILTLLVPMLFIAIFVNIIKGVIRTIKNRRNLSFLYCLPTIIYIVIPFIPLPDPEQFESKVVLRGCYEGTQNQVYILFRQDHRFDVHATGIFFSSDWYTGLWNRKKDTLFLDFDKNKVHWLLSDKIFIRNGYLSPADTGQHRKPMFYVGYCKGEN